MNRTRKICLSRGSTAIANRFKAQVVENGKVVKETPWTNNLILENGMNRLATTKLCDLFLYCAVGTGSTPTQSDSGAITATTSGTTCTADTSIFVVGDVGKLLRFATGEKAVITAYVSGTVVTLGDTLGVASSQIFTLYDINVAGLGSETRRTNNYLTGAGNCESTYSGGTYTHRRTYDFPVESTDGVAYSEVGFSHASGAGANLNMRGIFLSAPVPVLNGQALRVVYDVLVTQTPISPRDAEVVISGWPALEHPVAVDHTTNKFTLVSHGLSADDKIFFDGTVEPTGITFETTYYVVPDTSSTFQVAATPGGSAIDFSSNGTGVIMFTNTCGTEQLTTHAVSSVQSNGGTVIMSSGLLPLNEPNGTKYMNLVDNATAIPAFPVAIGSAVVYTGPSGSQRTLTEESYTSGSYVKYYSGLYSSTQGNSAAIRKFYINDGSQGASATDQKQTGLVYLFDHKQEKSNLFSLLVMWKFSWDRAFV